jgi:predicted KAP-like P-loop ATPase
MRYSDKPISRVSQDLLGRAGFALSLARAIDNLLVAEEGFVIAILGEWGSGKTSVIQLICRYLLHLEMERASHSPMGFETIASPTTLLELEEMAETFEAVEPRIAHYFMLNKDIARAGRDARWRELRRWVGEDSTADAAYRYWQLKNTVETHGRTVIVHFSPWLISGRAEITSALLSDLGRALGARLGEDIRRAFGKLLKRLMEFAPIAGAGLDIAAHGIGAGTLFRAGGDWSQKIAAKMTSGPSLDELKKELAQLLSRLNGRQILVVIDDLDRLTPPEALEMVSVVKSLADLPNVIYLLAYEEQRLSELITKATGIDGYSFLQKIVQYPVHLPSIDTENLSRLLDTDLEDLITGLSDEEDINRLPYAWREVLRFYISTPRDVRRLVNSFAVAAAALRDVTDPVDLLILEILRLFEPNLYQYVRRNIADLTEQLVMNRGGDISAGVEDVLKDVAEETAARRALALLFPKAEEALKTAIYAGSHDRGVRRKKRRISEADFAQAYFGLDPQRATWGRSEIDRILSHDDPGAAFRIVEQRIGSAAEADRSRLRRLFLDELRTTFEVSRAITKDWLRALLNASPTYIAAGNVTIRFLDVEDNEDRLRMIVIRTLEKLGIEERVTLIGSIVTEINDLSVLCAVFRSVAGDRRPEPVVRRTFSAVSFGDQTDMVREQLLARVRNVAFTGEIWRQVLPRNILLFWWGSTSDDEVWKFTSAATCTADALLSLLQVPIHPVYSTATAGNYETVAPTWSGILDLDALAACARNILIEGISEEDKQIARRFLTAVENRERDER